MVQASEEGVGFYLGSCLPGFLPCWQCWGRCGQFAWCSFLFLLLLQPNLGGSLIAVGWSLGAGRFMHLDVLYGYQGADVDAEQLVLTEQLFDAALV